MTLAERMLQWPQQVAHQVYSALFLPAADMHPAHARAHVPQSLWQLSPASLSPALGQGQAWRELDGRHIGHRLALLPHSVVTQISWNLGLLLSSGPLRRVVERSQLDELKGQGLDESDWQLVLQPGLETSRDEALGPIDQWAQTIRRRGEGGLLALADQLNQDIGQRLKWKIDPEASAGAMPSPEALNRAYHAPVRAWSRDWDECLVQVSPAR